MVHLGEAHGTIVIDAGGVEKGLGAAQKQLQSFDDAVGKVGMAVTAMGAVMLAVGVKAALTAARTEELGVVMENIAKQTGNSMKAIRDQEDAIKDLGITTQVADKLLVEFMRNNFDLTKATDLARVAQDAAVISMKDSSEALADILHGIVTLQPEVLRHSGLLINLEQEYAAWAKTSGRTVNSLTNTEKQTIALNAVLEQGTAIAGTYEAAMGTAGKQLRSIPRHVEEAANSYGRHLLPAMDTVVGGVTRVLKAIQSIPAPMQGTIAQMGALTGVLATAGGAMTMIIPKIIRLVAALKLLGGGSLMASMGPLAIVAGLIAAVLYVKNLEKAHIEEAAAILESSRSYKEYARLMRRAGLEARTLSESLFDVAKGAQDSGEAFDAVEFQTAARDVGRLSVGLVDAWKRWEVYGEGTRYAAGRMGVFQEVARHVVGNLSELELSIVGNKNEMILWGLRMGLSAEEALAFADALGEAVSYLGLTSDFMRAADGEAFDPYQEMQREAAAAVEEHQGAVVELRKEISDLAKETGLSRGVVRQYMEEWGYTAEEVKRIADDLRITGGEMRDLAADTGYTAEEIRHLNQELGFGEDAIREYAKAVEEADNTMQGMREGFFSALGTGFGELRGLAGEAEDSLGDYGQAMADLGAEQEELEGLLSGSQGKQTKTVKKNSRERIKAIEEERNELGRLRQEQLNEERAARDQSVIDLALSLAEESGEMEAWSDQTFDGPEIDLSSAFDSAEEISKAITEGILPIETVLPLITGYFDAIDDAMNNTGQVAEENKEKIKSLFMDAGIEEFEQQIGTLAENVPADPFGPLLESFDTAMSEIEATGERILAATDPLGAFGTAASEAGPGVAVLGDAAVVAGPAVSVLGDASVVAGPAVSVLGDASVVAGPGVSVLGDASVVAGPAVSVLGDASVVAGPGVSALGDASVVAGPAVSVLGDASVVAGPGVSGLGTAAGTAVGPLGSFSGGADRGTAAASALGGAAATASGKVSGLTSALSGLASAASRISGSMNSAASSIRSLGSAAGSATGQVSGLGGALSRAAGQASAAARQIQAAASAMRSIKVPSALQEKSPSPLAQSLMNVSALLKEISRTRLPSFDATLTEAPRRLAPGPMAGGGSTEPVVHHHYQLVVHTQSTHEPLMADFAFLEALAG